jgi:PAS domain S-box-containing protein
MSFVSWFRITISNIILGLGLSVKERDMVKPSDVEAWSLEKCSIEQAPEGVFWAKSNGLFFRVNSTLRDLLGYAEQELQCFHIYDLAEDLNKSQWLQLWKRFRQQKVLNHKVGFKTKWQKVLLVEIKASLVTLCREDLMCGFVREIRDDQQEIETLIAELKESEARFRTLYNNTPVMLQACDHDTRIYSVNKYWLETLGYEWDEVKGRQTREFMSERARNDVIHKVIPTLLHSGSIHDFEYELVKKNGEVIDVALTAVSDLNKDGKIIRTLSIIHNGLERL